MITACFNILMELLVKKKVTAKYLAEKFEISERTVYRYLDALTLAGVNLFTERGRNGGIKIADNYKIGTSFFTKEESSMIIEALSLWERSDIGKNADTLKNKLYALAAPTERAPLQLSSETFYIEGGLYGDTEQFKNKIEPLKRAIDGKYVATIEYHSREGIISERDIEPHAFVFKNMIWYVYAYCRMRKEFRTFKINRITKILLLDEVFVRHQPEEFNWNLTDNTEYPDVDLLIKLKQKARYDVEEWLGVSAVKPQRDKNWKYSASATVKYDGELLPKLLSFGGDIKIVSPKMLADNAKAAAREILDNQ